MKILNRQQIRDLDTYTIEQEGISGTELMERAGIGFTNWYMETFPERDKPINIICGSGNNGGDGMVIGRLLFDKGYNVKLVRLKTPRYSEEIQVQFKKNQSIAGLDTYTLSSPRELEWNLNKSIIIDALLGTGINRPVAGSYEEWINFLNTLRHCLRIAVDLPSGLAADQYLEGTAFRADFTFGIETPKLAYMVPENQQYVGQWLVKSIGLSQEFLHNCAVSHFTVEEREMVEIFKIPQKFDHKGINGHALLVGGSKGKAGAIALAGHSCLRSGTGLVTLGIPDQIEQIIQSQLPEAMCYSLGSSYEIANIPKHLRAYNALGIGPGLGLSNITGDWLIEIVKLCEIPLVLDADGLNLCSLTNLLDTIPKGSVITPHFKELDRLIGPVINHWERLEKIQKLAIKLGIVVVLKGAHSNIALPDGRVFFNTSGNPGMAKGGSGDVLTGIITGLLAKGYTAEEASLLGVFAHGLAGDYAAEKRGMTGMKAGDIIEFLPMVWQYLEEMKNKKKY